MAKNGGSCWDKVNIDFSLIHYKILLMAKLKIKVKPGANNNKVEKMGNGEFKIWIKEPPEKGKANKELIKYLKKITGIKISIVSGESSREKIIEFPTSREDFVERLERIL